MRVTYEWTQEEWDEAVRLATERPRRSGSIPALTYALVLIPLVGGTLEALVHLRDPGAMKPADTILPLLLMLVGVCLFAWLAGRQWSRRRRNLSQAAMPVGPCEAVLQEAGWSFQEGLPTRSDVGPGVDGVMREGRTYADSQLVVNDSITEPAPLEPEVPMSSLLPWKDMIGSRRSERVIVFLHRSGFHGVPIRCLSEDQAGHMQRMMSRKLRPSISRR